jgi:hypothetical protein
MSFIMDFSGDETKAGYSLSYRASSRYGREVLRDYPMQSMPLSIPRKSDKKQSILSTAMQTAHCTKKRQEVLDCRESQHLQLSRYPVPAT